jgi:hypothetical protein
MFVGIWTKTASTGAHLQAQQQRTAHTLQLARKRAAGAERRLQAADATLRQARVRAIALSRARLRAEQLSASRAAALAALGSSTSTLAKSTSTLASDIEGLDAYISRTGSSLDPAFLASQIDYLLHLSRQATKAANAAAKAAATATPRQSAGR